MDDSVFDAAIIGAGVVGAAIARELSKFKLDIVLIEKEADVSFGTSKANSGIIHAGFHSKPGTLKAKLCVQGNRMFDQLSEDLCFPFERCGCLVAAFSYEELQSLQTLYNQGKENHVPFLKIISRDAALELEPNLNPDILGALYSPTAGIVGPYEFCFALVENAQANGVNLALNYQVKRLRRDRDWFTIEDQKGNKIKARYVINAAGLYADEIASLLGLTDFKIHARKGEEYLLDRRVGNLVHHIIYPVPTKTSKGMLIIPTVDGPVMVGPTAEDREAKDDFSTTRSGLKAVFENAQRIMPSIRSNDIITSFVGLRPAATKDEFYIQATAVPCFINAAGIQSPGLTASPAIAEMVRDILAANGLRLELKSEFVSQRKVPPHTRVLLEQEKFEELEKICDENKQSARLICRCESVTEAEIVAAVKRGHTTLDGIKFSTRALSGRCQGGFCTHRILKIIGRETGLPIEKITKRGSGSEIVLQPLAKGSENRSPEDQNE